MDACHVIFFYSLVSFDSSFVHGLISIEGIPPSFPYYERDVLATTAVFGAPKCEGKERKRKGRKGSI